MDLNSAIWTDDLLLNNNLFSGHLSGVMGIILFWENKCFHISKPCSASACYINISNTNSYNTPSAIYERMISHEYLEFKAEAIGTVSYAPYHYKAHLIKQPINKRFVLHCYNSCSTVIC